MMNYLVFDIFVNNQIWLNWIVDDCYFSYITKLKIKSWVVGGVYNKEIGKSMLSFIIVSNSLGKWCLHKSKIWKPWKSFFGFKQQQNLMITHYKLIRDHAQPSHWKKFTKKSPHSIVELLIIFMAKYYYWKFLLLEMNFFCPNFYLLNGLF